MEFKSIEWHQENAKASEKWFADQCGKLGLTPDELREYIKQQNNQH